MPNFLLPAGPRSATAAPGTGDFRHDWVYSAVVLASGAGGTASIFTVPKGQAIPVLAAAGVLPTSPHQLVYTDLTSNLTQAGQLGNAIGDVSVKRIAINIEAQAQLFLLPVTSATASPGTYGAGLQEMAEILDKTSFEFKISSKTQQKGPTNQFPAFGGIFGSIASTGQTTATLAGATAQGLRGVVTNGNPTSTGRALKLPIQISRNDQIEGIVLVGGPGETLTFSLTTNQGQATLVWYMLDSIIRQDVR